MSEFNAPALDDVTDADQYAGDPVAPEHDLDVSTFSEEPSHD